MIQFLLKNFHPEQVENIYSYKYRVYICIRVLYISINIRAYVQLNIFLFLFTSFFIRFFLYFACKASTIIDYSVELWWNINLIGFFYNGFRNFILYLMYRIFQHSAHTHHSQDVVTRVTIHTLVPLITIVHRELNVVPAGAPVDVRTWPSMPVATSAI